LPPELVVDIAAAEAEAEAALTAHPSPPPKPSRTLDQLADAAPAPPPPAGATTLYVVPLADLRERLQMLREAGVEEYRDGPIVIRFSADILHAQREVNRPTYDSDTQPRW
jgi:hypothetical protein